MGPAAADGVVLIGGALRVSVARGKAHESMARAHCGGGVRVHCGVSFRVRLSHQLQGAKSAGPGAGPVSTRARAHRPARGSDARRGRLSVRSG